MLRQAFVHERVVGAKQIEHAPVLAEHALEKELRLLAKRLAQVVVEVRKQPHVRRDRVQVAEVQPLRREVVHERLRAWVGEHPADLAFEHRRLVQPAFLRVVEELVVRNAAPEKEGEPRRQLEVADPIRGAGWDAGRIRFDAKQEMRADEHGGDRHLDPGVEVVLGACLAIERERSAEVGVGHRPPVGAAQQRTQDLFRRLLLVVNPCRPRHENAPPAGRVARARRAVGADDGHRVDRRLDARMPIGIEARLVRLA